MFDHLGLHVSDLAASARFYAAALGPLGYSSATSDAESVSFSGPPGAPALYLYRGKSAAVAGAHVAWLAKERSSVKQFHERGLAAGGKDNGAPGVRKEYAANYYAAFLIDPDGNNVEVICYSE